MVGSGGGTWAWGADPDFRKGGLDEGPDGLKFATRASGSSELQFHQQAVRIVPSWMEQLPTEDQPASEPVLIPH